VRALSELEGCVLGILWKRGARSAYAVRREMLDSPSTHWSGSAGAIYPLLERLRKREWVRSRTASQGDRESTVYGITRAGRERLLAWIEPPFEPDVVSIAMDPLRTRVHFLGALPPARRRAFLRQARAELVRHLEELASEPVTDEFDRQSLRGGLRVTRARIAWLDEML
jgi:DNA-binding PadR family transcriptional regulator